MIYYFYGKDWFLTKLEADKKFDDYLITGEQTLLDQTDRLDVISGISFVALQINFGLIVYFFLVD